MSNFLKELPLYKVVNHFILVHSGIVIKREEQSFKEIMSQQTRDDFLWTREPFFCHKAVKDYTVVFGHTPTNTLFEMQQKAAPEEFTIWHDEVYHDKIGIDCGACFPGGRLGCLCLDDMTEYYV